MPAAADNPVACTIDGDALGQRLGWIRSVTDRGLLSHRLDGTVLRLTYRIDVLSELEEIAARERECCSFLRYSLERSGEDVHLTIEAPHGVGSDARWLFEQFLPLAQAADATKTCGCAPGGCG